MRNIQDDIIYMATNTQRNLKIMYPNYRVVVKTDLSNNKIIVTYEYDKLYEERTNKIYNEEQFSIDQISIEQITK